MNVMKQNVPIEIPTTSIRKTVTAVIFWLNFLIWYSENEKLINVDIGWLTSIHGLLFFLEKNRN